MEVELGMYLTKAHNQKILYLNEIDEIIQDVVHHIELIQK